MKCTTQAPAEGWKYKLGTLGTIGPTFQNRPKTLQNASKLPKKFSKCQNARKRPKGVETPTTTTATTTTAVPKRYKVQHKIEMAPLQNLQLVQISG